MSTAHTLSTMTRRSLPVWSLITVAVVIGGCSNDVDVRAASDRTTTTTTTTRPESSLEPSERETTGGSDSETGTGGGNDTGNETVDSILDEIGIEIPDLTIPEVSLPDLSIPEMTMPDGLPLTIPQIDGELGDCVELGLDFAKLAVGGLSSGTDTSDSEARLKAALPADLQDDLKIVIDAYQRMNDEGLLEGIDVLTDESFNNANNAIGDWLTKNCEG